MCVCSDNHFDVPDRTFHSLQRCYQLVTMQSVTDTKELIPEFFYLPEFLENREGLTAITSNTLAAAVDNYQQHCQY